MFQYNTIEEALEDLRQGRMILCTDDPFFEKMLGAYWTATCRSG